VVRTLTGGALRRGWSPEDKIVAMDLTVDMVRDVARIKRIDLLVKSIPARNSPPRSRAAPDALGAFLRKLEQERLKQSLPVFAD
jgi:hypothetical protein